jgi:hypothetical protein
MSNSSQPKHEERLVQKTIIGNKVMVSRAVEKRVALTVSFGDEEEGEEFVTVFISPARARQIAASLLNKADTAEGIR